MRVISTMLWVTLIQARHQDLAAGGPKTRRGGHIFKIQYWMYVATGGPNVKWGGTDLKWGAGDHCPLAGDSLALILNIVHESLTKYMSTTFKCKQFRISTSC